MEKLFLDTNIVLNFLGEREGFYHDAARLMTLADKKEIKTFTTALSIATTYYILTQYESKKAALSKIRKFKVLCHIAKMDDEIIEKAINAGFNDFEDAMQYCSAIASNCGILITRNEKDFKKAEMPIMNARDYLKTRNDSR